MRDDEDESEGRGVDLRGTFRVVRGVPGLFALIVFSLFNNFLGGAFMALMDAYGLSLVSVQAWGLLWGVLSAGFIVGGLLVARPARGQSGAHAAGRQRRAVDRHHRVPAALLDRPARRRDVVYMLLMPYAEASEQTILQKVVPYERQGRVFGFAQSVEQAASPLTAFLIAPIAQFVFIPFMTNGSGPGAIGDWFGIGADRGLALVFVLTGVIGLLVTGLALLSRPYRRLSAAYADSSAPQVEEVASIAGWSQRPSRDPVGGGQQRGSVPRFRDRR